MSAPLKKPDLIWFITRSYNDTTRLNVENTEEIVNYYIGDSILSQPISRSQRDERNASKIGTAVSNVLQNDNSSQVSVAVKYPGQVMTSYLFDYEDMVGGLTIVSGLQKSLQERENELLFDRIISGSGVFFNVTGFIASQPYGDDGYVQYAAYFDKVN